MKLARSRRNPSKRAADALGKLAGGQDRIYLLFQACQTVEEACDVTRHWFNANFPDVSGAIMLFSEDRSYLEPVASWGMDVSALECFRPSDCWALRRGRPHHVSSACGVGGSNCQHHRKAEDNWHLCLPLMAGGEALGTLHLHGPDLVGGSAVTSDADEQAHACDPEDLSEGLSMAIANLKYRDSLQQQAIRDPLTQLFNRRYLEDTLLRELHQAERAGAPLTFAILDVDHFKQFNDQFGHDAGDALLRAIGEVLNEQVRGGDIACRFGGEEFALVYPGMAEDVAFKKLEAIRQQIAALCLDHRGKTCDAVSISAGIAVYPEHGDDAQTLINLADKALYRSKEQGRNRVNVAQKSAPETSAERALKLVHDRDRREAS